MRDRSWVAGLALLVAACGGPGPADAPPGGSTIPAAEGPGAAATEPVASAAPSAPAPAKGRTVKEENEMYTFSYAYPDAAAAIPDLRALFDRRLEEEKADLVSATRSEKADAEKEGFPFRPHAREIEWKVVADVPGWLSLSSTQYGYTGGAHGMTVSDSLLWDRSAGISRKPKDLFTSAEALRSAVQKPFCDALDKERAKRRGEPVRRDSGAMFDECINPAEQTLILGSSNRRTFDRIGLLVGPYEAGPYAEGSYEVTLPVTRTVLAAVKPQFRSAFSVAP
ncbi:DUF4163 domain-containing protein [Novosphingobium panipatense]|uniref:DUF4163 domain-containing protein n=1 Tax=Novosphingobium TaxID=165696 RepID=UPI000CDB88DA|nr:DUF4163 domain-containing protein [Novosphingobium sp. HII-3]